MALRSFGLSSSPSSPSDFSSYCTKARKNFLTTRSKSEKPKPNSSLPKPPARKQRRQQRRPDRQGNSTLSMLAAQFANDLRRPVIDQTGIAGIFDINLQWTPDNAEQKSDPSRPSLFTAVQEQLGLKLASLEAPVEILVVDRAERPSEN